MWHLSRFGINYAGRTLPQKMVVVLCKQVVRVAGMNAAVPLPTDCLIRLMACGKRMRHKAGSELPLVMFACPCQNVKKIMEPVHIASGRQSVPDHPKPFAERRRLS